MLLRLVNVSLEEMCYVVVAYPDMLTANDSWRDAMFIARSSGQRP